jgi:hypothetical protein
MRTIKRENIDLHNLWPNYVNDGRKRTTKTNNTSSLDNKCQIYEQLGHQLHNNWMMDPKIDGRFFELEDYGQGSIYYGQFVNNVREGPFTEIRFGGNKRVEVFA